MSYNNRSHVWYELNTTAANRQRAIAFYGETVGWKTSQVPMGSGPEYTMLHAPAAGGEAGSTIAGIGQPLPETSAVPSHWLSYLRVEDVDATASAVTEHGGKVIQSAFDLPVGRMAVVADPQGATFALFKEADASSSNVASAPGTFHWTELWSPDIDAVAPFYAAALGFTVGSMAMGDGKPYTLFNDGDAMRCGGMTSPDPNIPAMWLPWIHVDGVDDAVARAVRLGGALLGDIFDAPGVGRLAVVKDNVGAAIGLITPAS